jgi:hypothetical protein
MFNLFVSFALPSKVPVQNGSNWRDSGWIPSYPPFDVAQDKLQRVSRLIRENKPGFPRARE